MMMAVIRITLIKIPPPVSQEFRIKGKVIDGYVSGAKVWLDINGNNQLDNDEPSTISKSTGDYLLELSETQKDCIAYSTLYVDVPVGAVDEDSGVITQAYQMSFPPRLKTYSNDELLNRH